MNEHRYILEIEELLRKIPELERQLEDASQEVIKFQIQRSLKAKEKRLEHLIPFKFRLYLRNLCKEREIISTFL